MIKNNGFHNRHSPVLRFSPLSLFTAGAPGAWYDPSDTATLFQDNAGTTPVTAVEQPVGLMLDKSQGLVLGPELVTNGDFSNGTTGWSAWNTNAQISVASGQMTVTQPVGGNQVGVGNTTAYTTVVGRFYVVALDVISFVGANPPQMRIGDFNGSASINGLLSAGTGRRYFYFQANTTATFVNVATQSAAGSTITFDNISVKELPGNHAFQSTSASRPVLSARYNLLTKTEQFNDAAWGGANTTVVANTSGTTDPLGGNTADLLYPTTTGSFRDRTQQVSMGASGIYIVSEYAKAGGFRWAYFRNLAASNYAAHFDLQTGTLGTVQAGFTATITPEGNGWYRCTITNTSPIAAPWCAMGMSDADNSASATVSGTNGIYVWGASIVPANQSTLPYQRVNTATDYDTTGFLPYLKFDGNNDSLSTNSINFTSTDKMSVFAGVRKLSDAARGMIVELSATSASNNGTFGMTAPNAASATYAFESKGTVLTDAVGTPFAAPLTSVLSGLSAILTDSNILRINGVQADSDAGDQGTGNYGNYPLFIGRRGGSSLPFNGQLYSMVIVGKAVTAGELSSTETWVNGKTGAYA